jgi:hypothetical protein
MYIAPRRRLAKCGIDRGNFQIYEKVCQNKGGGGRYVDLKIHHLWVDYVDFMGGYFCSFDWGQSFMN